MTRRGFSLAEVMVALVFLTIAVLGLVSVQIFALRATSRDRNTHQAAAVAASRMAEIEALARQDYLNLEQNLPTGRQPDPEHKGFETCVVVTPEPDPPVKRVDLAVYYQDDQGTHEYAIWTYFDQR